MYDTIQKGLSNKMKKNPPKTRKFGTRSPRQTQRNKLIRVAVEKAVYDYKEAYKRLATE